MRIQFIEAKTIPAGNPKKNEEKPIKRGVHNLTGGKGADGSIGVEENCSDIFVPSSYVESGFLIQPPSELIGAGIMKGHAAFRFLAAFFFAYSACRLSITLFGTEINCFASFSKRAYSSDGGLLLFCGLVIVPALPSVSFAAGLSQPLA